MASRKEDARIEREYREYVEALAVVAKKLDTCEAANDETTYTAIYTEQWIPVQVGCRRSIGGDLTSAAIKDAYQLARVA